MNTSCIVTITSESLESNLSVTLTSSTSTLLTLLSDQDYNISVVASNCMGTSEPFESTYILYQDRCQ